MGIRNTILTRRRCEQMSASISRCLNQEIDYNSSIQTLNQSSQTSAFLPPTQNNALQNPLQKIPACKAKTNRALRRLERHDLLKIKTPHLPRPHHEPASRPRSRLLPPHHRTNYFHHRRSEHLPRTMANLSMRHRSG